MILLKIDMLEVKKDRIVEINKSIKKCIKCGNWSYKKELDKEKKDLLIQIELMELKRGE